jgi:ketosteroid isomerase-like protein
MTMDQQARLDRVKAYFTAVDDADYDGIVAQFTEDCVYVHDPRDATLRGHDELRSLFVERGPKAGVHEVTAVTTLGADALGVVLQYHPGPDADPVENDGEHVSFARFADDGRIAAYRTGFLEAV